MRITKAVLAVSLMLSLASCGGDNKPQVRGQGPATEVTLRQEWFPNSNYAGAVLAKEKYAETNGVTINIVPGADNIDPIKLVLSGSDDFGDAGADRVIEAIDKGADLVVVGVLNLHSPTCFIALKDKNINSPQDFLGHKVGILTGTSTEYVYRALLSELRLDESKINEIEVPFDLGTFVLGEYDVRPAFVYDEPISLDLRNIEYNLIEPKNYGVSFLGTVYFTRRELVEKEPERVQAFINSVAAGWTSALAEPELAIQELCKLYPDLDKEREMLALVKSRPYFEGSNGRILWAERKDWEGMLKTLRDLGKIGDVDIDSCIDNRFLMNYLADVQSQNDREE